MESLEFVYAMTMFPWKDVRSCNASHLGRLFSIGGLWSSSSLMARTLTHQPAEEPPLLRFKNLDIAGSRSING